MRTLKANDTLTQIVRQEATQRGVQLSPQQEFQAVMSLAKDNKLANPDRIWAGQRLNLAELHAQLDQTQGSGKALAAPSLTANATTNPAIAEPYPVSPSSMTYWDASRQVGTEVKYDFTPTIGAATEHTDWVWSHTVKPQGWVPSTPPPAASSSHR